MPLRWDEVADVEAEAFTLATVPGAVRRAIGDPGAGIDEAVGSLEALLELSRRHEAEGQGDAPWPPNYAQAGRRAAARPAVARSAGRRPSTSTAAARPRRPAAGGRARERAAAVAAGDRNAGLPTESGTPSPSTPDADRPAQDERSRSSRSPGPRRRRRRSRASSAGRRATPRPPPHLEPADVLVDGMRGRSSLWYRVRVNLTHVPEADRPAQEPLDPDYDPWAGYEWPDRAGQLERAPRRPAEKKPG